VPVVPVALHGTGRIWSPGHWAIHAGQVRGVIGSPLPISGLTRHDVARLRDQAWETVCSAYRDLVLAASAKACHRQ
jgi:1-acyl-sn-glycerol-3-phosphate acyltransferase